MSHPAWVCGLKRAFLKAMKYVVHVTPCVGVRIETVALVRKAIPISVSHPAWVCGLKQCYFAAVLMLVCHTLRGCAD